MKFSACKIVILSIHKFLRALSGDPHKDLSEIFGIPIPHHFPYFVYLIIPALQQGDGQGDAVFSKVF